MDSIRANHSTAMNDDLTPPSPVPNDPTPKSNDERTLGLVCHLLSFATFLIPYLGNIIGPLVLWLIKRGESPYIDAHGKEVLNFNISWSIYGLIAFASMLVLIGFVLLPVVCIAWVVLVIIGSIKASEGKLYRYPMTIRFIN